MKNGDQDLARVDQSSLSTARATAAVNETKDTTAPLDQTRHESKTPYQRWDEAAQRIQAKCACVRWDARECSAARYRRPMDDLERHSGWDDWRDDECECRCHDELRELSEDIFGPDDE